MGLVRPLLAAEVPLTVAPAVGRTAAAILAPEALHRRPRLQQRAVHREVLAAQQPLHPWQGQQRRQEPCAIAALNTRSRFFVKPVASHTRSSTARAAALAGVLVSSVLVAVVPNFSKLAYQSGASVPLVIVVSFLVTVLLLSLLLGLNAAAFSHQCECCVFASSVASRLRL